MCALPKIAAEEIPNDGDSQVFSIYVRDENDRPVYSATLSYAGSWFRKEP